MICDGAETLTCVGTETACSAVAPMLAELESIAELCTRATRRSSSFLLSMMPMGDNGTACEANCTGALDLLGDFAFISVDFSGADASTNLKMQARLRQLFCANAEVTSCAAVSTGNGYSACDMGQGGSDDDDSSPSNSNSSSPPDPEQYLTQCDVSLAITVSMALTVADPSAFVADNANKRAVEAGIASAAGVTTDAVEAVLTVGQRRLRVQDTQRRLQGTVDVAATIHTASAEAAAAMQGTVGSINATQMTASIATAFTNAGITMTIEVAQLEPPTVAATANEAIAAAAADTESPSSGALKITIASGILAAVFFVAM